jgi:hypothetical protein
MCINLPDMPDMPACPAVIRPSRELFHRSIRAPSRLLDIRPDSIQDMAIFAHPARTSPGARSRTTAPLLTLPSTAPSATCTVSAGSTSRLSDCLTVPYGPGRSRELRMPQTKPPHHSISFPFPGCPHRRAPAPRRRSPARRSPARKTTWRSASRARTPPSRGGTSRPWLRRGRAQPPFGITFRHHL